MLQKKVVPFLALMVGAFSFIQILIWLVAQKWPQDYNGFYYLVEWRSRIAGEGGVYSKFQWFLEVSGSLLKWLQINEVIAYPFVVIGAIIAFALAILKPSFEKKNFSYFAFLFLWVLGSRLLFYGTYGYLKQGWGMAIFAMWLNVSTMGLRLIMLPFVLGFHFSSAFLVSLQPLLKKKTLLSVLSFVILGFILWKKQQVLTYFYGAGIGSSSYLEFYLKNQISAFDLFEVFFCMLINILLLVDLKKERSLFVYVLLSAIAFLPIWGKETWRMWVSGNFIVMIIAGKALWSGKSSILSRYVPLLTVLLLLANLLLPKEPHPLGSSLKPETLVAMKERVQRWIPQSAVIQASIDTQYEIAYILERKTFWKPEHPDFQLRTHAAEFPCEVQKCIALDSVHELWKY